MSAVAVERAGSATVTVQVACDDVSIPGALIALSKAYYRAREQLEKRAWHLAVGVPDS